MTELGINILGRSGDGCGIVEIDRQISNIAAYPFERSRRLFLSALSRAPRRTVYPDAASWRATSNRLSRLWHDNPRRQGPRVWACECGRTRSVR